MKNNICLLVFICMYINTDTSSICKFIDLEFSMKRCPKKYQNNNVKTYKKFFFHLVSFKILK